MYKLNFLFFILLQSAFLCAQTHNTEPCAMKQRLLKLSENNDQILNEYQEYIQQEFKSDQNIQKRSTITIPVVVHVIHGGQNVGSGPNISAERVAQQIEILNEDYRQLNADASGVPVQFSSQAADTQIEFCLIKKDASGNPHPGINRHQYNVIPNVDYIEEVIKPETVWNPKKFLNIWTVKMPDNSILGYSYLPLPSIVNTSQDGVVINYTKFGVWGSSILGRTATHEIGHYLGLQHPWGDIESCNNDDGINDTPVCRGPYYDCPVYPQVSCGTVDMSMNFMDYVDDPCMFMFTVDQGLRMQSVLANERSSLSVGFEFICDLTSSASELSLDQDIILYPNPSKGLINLDIPENLKDQIDQWKIVDLQGKLVIQGFSSDLGEEIQLDAFQNGAYFFVFTGKEVQICKKFMLIK